MYDEQGDKMRTINKSSAFKTCEIAIAKEELGFPVRRAVNRRGNHRAVKPNPIHIDYLKKAIKELSNSGRKNPTYKEIREKALELYKQENDKTKILKSYRGVMKLNMPKSEALKVIEDKGLIYES